jgi:hypothetical protein
MIGAHDFIRYYDWTFAYLRRRFGQAEVERFWGETIAFNSQGNVLLLVQAKGLEGMAEYWGFSLTSEAAGYTNTLTEDYFRIDMYRCPSKGFLIQIGQREYDDYCNHCIGWIKPIMDRTGFVVDHEHNHAGQCWWEMRPLQSGWRQGPPPLRSGDVRTRDEWQQSDHDLWLMSRQIKR